MRKRISRGKHKIWTKAKKQWAIEMVLLLQMQQTDARRLEVANWIANGQEAWSLFKDEVDLLAKATVSNLTQNGTATKLDRVRVPFFDFLCGRKE